MTENFESQLAIFGSHLKRNFGRNRNRNFGLGPNFVRNRNRTDLRSITNSKLLPKHQVFHDNRTDDFFYFNKLILIIYWPRLYLRNKITFFTYRYLLHIIQIDISSGYLLVIWNRALLGPVANP